MIDPTRLEPGVQAWLARIPQLHAELGQPADATDRTEQRAREAWVADALAAEFGTPIDVRAEPEDIEIAGLAARRFRPDVAGPLPTQVFLHGGGFVSGSARLLGDAQILSARAANAGIQIISLEYSLAPEHPYPAAVDDTIAAFTALATDESWGADPTRLGVGGGSAGGHISAVTALRLREAADGPRLAHVLLEIPAVDLVGEDWPSMSEFASDKERAAAMQVALAYAGPSPSDPLINPVRVADLTGLPRTLVMTAELDPLRDAAEEYGRRIAAAGGDAEVIRGAGQLHGTQGLTGTTASSRDWQQAATAELKTYLGRAI
ncbi:MAG: alpha/beta hydrolase [Microbacterium sp.]